MGCIMDPKGKCNAMILPTQLDTLQKLFYTAQTLGHHTQATPQQGPSKRKYWTYAIDNTCTPNYFNSHPFPTPTQPYIPTGSSPPSRSHSQTHATTARTPETEYS